MVDPTISFSLLLASNNILTSSSLTPSAPIEGSIQLFSYVSLFSFRFRPAIPVTPFAAIYHLTSPHLIYRRRLRGTIAHLATLIFRHFVHWNEFGTLSIKILHTRSCCLSTEMTLMTRGG